MTGMWRPYGAKRRPNGKTRFCVSKVCTHYLKNVQFLQGDSSRKLEDKRRSWIIKWQVYQYYSVFFLLLDMVFFKRFSQFLWWNLLQVFTQSPLYTTSCFLHRYLVPNVLSYICLACVTCGGGVGQAVRSGAYQTIVCRRQAEASWPHVLCKAETCG